MNKPKRMSKIKAALHEHLKTTSKLRKNSFDRAFHNAIYRLGPQCLVSVIDFDDKRYKSFIGLPGYPRDYIGEDKRAVRVHSRMGDIDYIVVHDEEVTTKQCHLLVHGLGDRKSVV